MSVNAIAELWDTGRQASLDWKCVREYQRVFLVSTTDRLDGPLEIYRYIPPIPKLYSYYVDAQGHVDLGARVKKITPRQRPDDPQLWEVTVDYSSRIENPEQAAAGQEEPNPLARPSVLNWSMEKYQKATDQAFDDSGNPTIDVVNSAGERFDPVPEIDDSRPVLTITRNEPTVDPNVIVAYQDAVNTDTFFGADAGLAKIRELSADSNYENGLFYWKCKYVIEFRREGWKLKLLDQGFYKLDVNNNKVLMTDPKSGFPYSSPVLLDGHGKQLGTGGAAVFLPFRVYKELPFAPLNLP